MKEIGTGKLIIIIAIVIVVVALIWIFILGKAPISTIGKPKGKSANDVINNPGSGADNASAGTRPATVDDAFTETYWQALNKKGITNMTADDADRSKTDAETVYGALGYWQFNHPDTVNSVFNSAGTKAYVSMIAQSFNNEYGDSLYSFIKTHLTSDQLTKVRNIVAALKDY